MDALKKPLWDHGASVRRYRRLLETHLTDIERRFVERRLAEEQEVTEIYQESQRVLPPQRAPVRPVR
jgi:hypothetical protein